MGIYDSATDTVSWHEDWATDNYSFFRFYPLSNILTVQTDDKSHVGSYTIWITAHFLYYEQQAEIDAESGISRQEFTFEIVDLCSSATLTIDSVDEIQYTVGE